MLHNIIFCELIAFGEMFAFPAFRGLWLPYFMQMYFKIQENTKCFQQILCLEMRGSQILMCLEM